MSEFILFLVIAVLAGLLGFEKYENRKERNKFIQAIMSKTAQDLKDFELADKIKFDVPTQPEYPDMTAVEDLNEKDFTKHVLEES